MKNANKIPAVIIAAPAVGALVFGASSFGIPNTHWGWFSIAGWVAGWLALQMPEMSQAKVFASETKTQQQTTILIDNPDGFTGRIPSDIPFYQWQRIARIIVQKNYKNLNGSVIKKAFPNMVQEERRDLRNELVGLLKPEHIGVVVEMDNGHARITHPVGWSFFARVANGMVYPLEKNKLPYTPPARKSLKSALFPQHTRATRAILAPNSGNEKI